MKRIFLVAASHGKPDDTEGYLAWLQAEVLQQGQMAESQGGTSFHLRRKATETAYGSTALA